MLRADDLEAAVAAGIVTEAQAAALRELALQREKERAVALGHEERFRFMRGFNDFFFAIGVLLLGFGMTFFAMDGPAANLIAAAIIWALAELLLARMRLVLPGILLACLFVAFVYRAVPNDLWLFGPPPASTKGIPMNWLELIFGGWFRTSAPATVVAKALLASAAAAVFYARFRLPFALLLVAGGLVAAVSAGARPFLGPAALSLLQLGCGLAVFIAAMAFDFSDRERLTRRADCAFWLHLLAAPLIVHSLITMVTDRLSVSTMPNHVAITIAIIVGVLTIVAVAIDRRALLVSALAYLGIVIAYAIVAAGADAKTDLPFVLFATLIILGALIVALGVGWLPLRRALVRLLPIPLLSRLPPVAAAA